MTRQVPTCICDCERTTGVAAELVVNETAIGAGKNTPSP